jgi:hypothetical protein
MACGDVLIGCCAQYAMPAAPSSPRRVMPTNNFLMNAMPELVKVLKKLYADVNLTTYL